MNSHISILELALKHSLSVANINLDLCNEVDYCYNNESEHIPVRWAIEVRNREQTDDTEGIVLQSAWYDELATAVQWAADLSFLNDEDYSVHLIVYLAGMVGCGSVAELQL